MGHDHQLDRTPWNSRGNRRVVRNRLISELQEFTKKAVWCVFYKSKFVQREDLLCEIDQESQKCW